MFDERVAVMIAPGPGGRWEAWVSTDGKLTQSGALTPPPPAVDARELADAMGRGALMTLAATTPDRANTMVRELADAGTFTRDDLDRLLGGWLDDAQRAALRYAETEAAELAAALSGSGALGPSTETAGRGGGARPVPALGRLLLSVLVRLGYHRVAYGELRLTRGGQAWCVTNPYQRLHALDGDAVVEGVRWADVGCTYLPALERHRTRLEQVADRFPPRMRPIGFFLGIVDEITAHRPRGHVVSWSTRQGTARTVVHGPVRACSCR